MTTGVTKEVEDCQAGCWVWHGGLNVSGYGVKNIQAKTWILHRAAWAWANWNGRGKWKEAAATIPKGMCVLHTCDNPPCVNPHHLFLGTIADNNRDRDAKGRQNNQKKTHCPSGHAYDGFFPGGIHRRCMTCKRTAQREWKKRRAALRS